MVRVIEDRVDWSSVWIESNTEKHQDGDQNVRHCGPNSSNAYTCDVTRVDQSWIGFDFPFFFVLFGIGSFSNIWFLVCIEVVQFIRGERDSVD